MHWGYMGKVPNRGDFITHNVLPAVRDLMFEWCQATMAVSREQLGDGWMGAYLTLPIWHFSAGPGVISETGLIGTLIPSVDRVGRHFPFVVLADYQGSAFAAWRQPAWSAAMESCILSVLEDDWKEDVWQQELAQIALPDVKPARLRWPTDEGNMMIPGAADENDWLQALLNQKNDMVMWWTQGSAYVEAATLLTEGLPKVGQFAAMMVGKWHEHGWQQGALVD